MLYNKEESRIAALKKITETNLAISNEINNEIMDAAKNNRTKRVKKSLKTKKIARFQRARRSATTSSGYS